MSESPRAIRPPPPTKMSQPKKLTLVGLLSAILALVIEHGDVILAALKGK